ncbi:hypothetical protein [Burkholderia gladioli]|uniref:hypothetical protein n=1 Tax=Burkholderia gladioli TaxID=28095 RepID=UPI00163E2CE9|nr:hypothetical protein [Burkholderia gladioli]
MKKAALMKFVAAVLLFAAWLGLVLFGLAPAPALVDAIGYSLVGLGVYHATAEDGQLVLKFVAGVLLFGAWLILVARGMTPAAGLVDAIGYGLMALGIYHAKGFPTLPVLVAGGAVAAVSGASAAEGETAAPSASALPASWPAAGASGTVQ